MKEKKKKKKKKKTEKKRDKKKKKKQQQKYEEQLLPLSSSVSYFFFLFVPHVWRYSHNSSYLWNKFLNPYVSYTSSLLFNLKDLLRLIIKSCNNFCHTDKKLFINSIIYFVVQFIRSYSSIIGACCRIIEIRVQLNSLWS